VQVEHAMVVVAVRGYDAVPNVNVGVAGDRSGFEDIQRVVIHERNDARDLGDHEERQQIGTKAPDRSNAHHARL
jgi:hypothetical protein